MSSKPSGSQPWTLDLKPWVLYHRRSKTNESKAEQAVSVMPCMLGFAKEVSCMVSTQPKTSKSGNNTLDTRH